MGPTFTTPGVLHIHRDEILWAAITVGRRSWADVLRHGLFSSFEIEWRAAMVLSNLARESDGHIVKSPAFHALDPSEKGAVSYFLGNVFAKLVAWRLFQVPWLLHVDVNARFVPGGPLAATMRPDFVGLDSAGRWIVMESKGRSGQLATNVINKAKEQTLSVRHVNGALPRMRIVSAVHFRSDELRLTLADPYEILPGSPDLEIDVGEAMDEYYAAIIRTIRSELDDEDRIRSENFKIVDVPRFDFNLGLRTDLFEAPKESLAEWALRGAEPSWVLQHLEASDQLKELQQILGGPDELANLAHPYKEGHVFPDGVYIRTGETWETAHK